jgi:adhesin transport system outer membrane protein
MKKCRIILVLVFCFVGMNSISWGSPLTLKEAVELTIKTNPEVLASANRRLATDEQLEVARSGYFPRIDLSAGTARERLDDTTSRSSGLNNTTFNRHNSNLTIFQMLFDGFGVSSEVSRQQARVESSASMVGATSEDLGLRATAVYLEVMRRQESSAIAAENLDSHQRIYERIRRRTDGGLGRRSDFELAASRLALAKANLRDEQGNLKNAEATFIRVVGTPPLQLELPGLSENNFPVSSSQAQEKAMLIHPAIRSASADVASAEAQYGVAKSALSPRVDLELTANRDSDVVHSSSKDSMAMLRLKYNFFRGGADAGRVNEARYQIREANDNLNRVRRQVLETLSHSFNALDTSRDRVVELKAYVESSRATRDDYAKQFYIGQRTLLDLLNAENEHATARSSLVSDLYSELLSKYRVMAGMGALLKTLEIIPLTEATP